MPDDVAEEKVKALLALGAHVERVRPASIVDKKQVSQIIHCNCSPTLLISQHLLDSMSYVQPSISMFYRKAVFCSTLTHQTIKPPRTSLANTRSNSGRNTGASTPHHSHKRSVLHLPPSSSPPRTSLMHQQQKSC